MLFLLAVLYAEGFLYVFAEIKNVQQRHVVIYKK